MPKDLRVFLDKLLKEAPQEIITIEKEVDPKFEISAILQHLENRESFPAVLFKRVKNMNGESSDFQMVTNVFGNREKCALALDLPLSKSGMEVSLEYSKRQLNFIEPVVVSKKEAPETTTPPIIGCWSETRTRQASTCLPATCGIFTPEQKREENRSP